jgi:putative intracellular protease/amidase
MAMICQGPWLLVSAGLVKGRKLTRGKTSSSLPEQNGSMEAVLDRHGVPPSDIAKFNRRCASFSGEAASAGLAPRAHSFSPSLA